MSGTLLGRSAPVKIINEKPFGAVITADAALKSADLCSQPLGAELKELWHNRGLVVLRGLTDMTPEVLAEISKCLGPLDPELNTGSAGQRRTHH
eukprot:1762151-Amphidinium_carterae.1